MALLDRPMSAVLRVSLTSVQSSPVLCVMRARLCRNGNGLIRQVHVGSTQSELNVCPIFAGTLRDEGTAM